MLDAGPAPPPGAAGRRAAAGAREVRADPDGVRVPRRMAPCGGASGAGSAVCRARGVARLGRRAATTDPARAGLARAAGGEPWPDATPARAPPEGAAAGGVDGEVAPVGEGVQTAAVARRGTAVGAGRGPDASGGAGGG